LHKNADFFNDLGGFTFVSTHQALFKNQRKGNSNRHSTLECMKIYSFMMTNASKTSNWVVEILDHFYDSQWVTHH